MDAGTVGKVSKASKAVTSTRPGVGGSLHSALVETEAPIVLAELPAETWCIVAEHLPGPALARMSSACRALGNAARKESLWKMLCEDRFPHFTRSRLACPCSWKALYKHHHLASLPRPETLLVNCNGETHRLTEAPPVPTRAPEPAEGPRYALLRHRWTHRRAAAAGQKR